ncbi:MAG: hypothetical protein JWM85_936 [Acidimicrobiaceae bacterium]|nr:hypothetical protein [Acidimicrobiaceae bacterium]
MSDYELPNPDEATGGPAVQKGGPPVAEGSGGAGTTPPPPPMTSPAQPSSASPHQPGSVLIGRRATVRRLVAHKRSRWVAVGAMSCAAAGLSAALITSPSIAATQLASSSTSAPAAAGGGGGTNARSAPAPGGAAGTVNTVSKSSFTLTTSAGQKVTVDESSSTKYLKGTTATSASAVKKGEVVLVLGTVSSTTIKSTEVVVNYKPASAPSATKVIPFTRGQTSASKQVGQIPANWSQGSGTIVTGTAANKATEAALAAYPGGVVDRVVKLSNGEYNVHYIGVNWPHHVFVSASFKVVGAL